MFSGSELIKQGVKLGTVAYILLNFQHIFQNAEIYKKIKSCYLKVEAPLKLLISQSKCSGYKKFTLS